MSKRRPRSLVKVPQGWRIEAVTPRMTKPCAACKDVPEGVRAVHTVDAIPFPSTDIYCAACSVAAMRQQVAKVNERISGYEKYLKENDIA